MDEDGSASNGGPVLARRHLLSGIGGLAAGGLLGGWWGRTRTRPGPLDEHGLPTADLDLGDAERLAAQAADAPVPHPADAARLVVLRWDPSYQGPRGTALDRYGPDGEDHPVLAADVGLMVTALASPHCGCLVNWCATSRWFEGPCHGSRFNRWGEWTGGPAPRGLDRYRSRVEPDGRLVAALTQPVVGLHRENGVLDQSQEGPSCVDA